MTKNKMNTSDKKIKISITNPLKYRGFVLFTSTEKKERASHVSNTYIFETDGKWYVIDTSCGSRRRKELKKFLDDKKNYSILCTHYHNDHIANNWFIAKKGTTILYHKKAASKIPYLRTNSTGQILKMYRDLDREGFLARLGFFSKKSARFLSGSSFASRFILPPLLFITAFIISFKNTGFMPSARRKIKYLDPDSKTIIELNDVTLSGWIIDKNLYAFETPGHTDCHIIYYKADDKILFCGDALNFLNPNDIQFGNIEETFQSIDLIFELVKNEKIETVASGHYHPIEGNDNALKYIKEIKENHEYVYGIIKSELERSGINISFKEIFDIITNIEDPVLKKLKRISFPVSTLVFLDVFIYKLITEIQKELMNNDTMENTLKCREAENRNSVP